MENDQILNRLASLKKEFETGHSRIRELEQEQAYLRETMLRISGAIQVLQELMDQANAESAENENTIAAAS